MPTPFSSQDLGRIFDGRMLTRGRSLGLTGGVTLQLEGDTICGVVQDRVGQYQVRLTPARIGRRVVFDHHCSCGTRACAHLAAAGFAALDRFPELRQPEQQSFLDALVTPGAPRSAVAVTPAQEPPLTSRSKPEPEPQPRPELHWPMFELAPAEAPHACSVTTLLLGERTDADVPATPTQIAADERMPTVARQAVWPGSDSLDVRSLRIGMMTRRTQGDKEIVAERVTKRWAGW